MLYSSLSDADYDDAFELRIPIDPRSRDKESRKSVRSTTNLRQSRHSTPSPLSKHHNGDAVAVYVSRADFERTLRDHLLALSRRILDPPPSVNNEKLAVLQQTQQSLLNEVAKQQVRRVNNGDRPPGLLPYAYNTVLVDVETILRNIRGCVSRFRAPDDFFKVYVSAL